jgi:hypothetical protein
MLCFVERFISFVRGKSLRCATLGMPKFAVSHTTPYHSCLSFMPAYFPRRLKATKPTLHSHVMIPTPKRHASATGFSVQFLAMHAVVFVRSQS